MAIKKLALVNGIPKMVEEAGAPTIYEETILIVDGSPGAGELTGPIAAGTNITLPGSQTYSGDELEVYISGDRLTVGQDYISVSSTQISFLFDLYTNDLIKFRIDRSI